MTEIHTQYVLNIIKYLVFLVFSGSFRKKSLAVAIKVLQERIGRYRPQRVSPDEIAYHILVPQRPAQLFILNHESVKLEIEEKSNMLFDFFAALLDR